VIRENNLRTVEDVTNYTKAGGDAGDAYRTLKKFLKRYGLKK